MMHNFKEIYDDELSNHDGFIFRILDDREMRAFVYEICKKMIEGYKPRSARDAAIG